MAAKPKAVVTIQRTSYAKNLPTKIGSLLDRRWQLKLQKEALEAELKKVAEEVKLHEDAIFLRLGKEGDLEGARGTLCQASISRVVVPVAEDWAAIHGWIKKGRGTDRFAILQRRLGVTAVRELQDDGVTVPGVGSFEQKKLSLTKVK